MSGGPSADQPGVFFWNCLVNEDITRNFRSYCNFNKRDSKESVENLSYQIIQSLLFLERIVQLLRIQRSMVSSMVSSSTVVAAAGLMAASSPLSNLTEKEKMLRGIDNVLESFDNIQSILTEVITRIELSNDPSEEISLEIPSELPKNNPIISSEKKEETTEKKEGGASELISQLLNPENNGSNIVGKLVQGVFDALSDQQIQTMMRSRRRPAFPS